MHRSRASDGVAWHGGSHVPITAHSAPPPAVHVHSTTPTSTRIRARRGLRARAKEQERQNRGSAGTHHYLRRTLCTRVRAAGPLHVDAGPPPLVPGEVALRSRASLGRALPGATLSFSFFTEFGGNFWRQAKKKRAPVANRPSPFPSALIKRGDSWHPLPRVELMTLFSCGAEIQWETIVFPRIGASSREFNHGEAQTNGATRKRFRQRPCVM